MDERVKGLLQDVFIFIFVCFGFGFIVGLVFFVSSRHRWAVSMKRSGR